MSFICVDSTTDSPQAWGEMSREVANVRNWENGTKVNVGNEANVRNKVENVRNKKANRRNRPDIEI